MLHALIDYREQDQLKLFTHLELPGAGAFGAALQDSQLELPPHLPEHLSPQAFEAYTIRIIHARQPITHHGRVVLPGQVGRLLSRGARYLQYQPQTGRWGESPHPSPYLSNPDFLQPSWLDHHQLEQLIRQLEHRQDADTIRVITADLKALLRFLPQAHVLIPASGSIVSADSLTRVCLAGNLEQLTGQLELIRQSMSTLQQLGRAPRLLFWHELILPQADPGLEAAEVPGSAWQQVVDAPEPAGEAVS